MCIRDSCRAGTLFTYLDEGLLEGGPVPATTNRIEGGVNAQIRHMLREHRGLRLTRRVKAAFWWCYMDLEARASPKEILKEMPTDVLIAEFYRAAAEASEKDEAVGRWGTAVPVSYTHLDVYKRQGSRSLMRSAHTSSGSPMDTHTSV